MRDLLTGGHISQRLHPKVLQGPDVAVETIAGAIPATPRFFLFRI
jgi:hypothetical protein